MQLSEGRNRDAPDLERVLAATFHELRQREDRVSDAPFAEVDGNDVVEKYVTLGFGIRPLVNNGNGKLGFHFYRLGREADLLAFHFQGLLENAVEDSV